MHVMPLRAQMIPICLQLDDAGLHLLPPVIRSGLNLTLVHSLLTLLQASERTAVLLLVTSVLLDCQ